MKIHYLRQNSYSCACLIQLLVLPVDLIDLRYEPLLNTTSPLSILLTATVHFHYAIREASLHLTYTQDLNHLQWGAHRQTK